MSLGNYKPLTCGPRVVYKHTPGIDKWLLIYNDDNLSEYGTACCRSRSRSSPIHKRADSSTRTHAVYTLFYIILHTLGKVHAIYVITDWTVARRRTAPASGVSLTRSQWLGRAYTTNMWKARTLEGGGWSFFFPPSLCLLVFVCLIILVPPRLIGREYKVVLTITPHFRIRNFKLSTRSNLRLHRKRKRPIFKHCIVSGIVILLFFCFEKIARFRRYKIFF